MENFEFNDYNGDYENYSYENFTAEEVIDNSSKSCFNDVSCVTVVVVNVVIFLLGVSGNGIVIWISGLKMKRSVNTCWYLSLAISDFIFCTCLPFNIVNMATSAWPFGLVMCKFTSFIMFLNMFSSIFLLVIISVDRCVSVVFPVWAQNHRTVKAASVLVALAWIVSVALSVPSAITRDIKVHGDKTICHNNFGKVMLSHQTIAFSRFVCGFLIPFVIITLCYTIIVLKLKSSRMTKSSKPFKVMSALIVTFFVCWLPYHIFILLELNHHNHSIKILTAGLMVSGTLASANSFLNPILYVFMGNDFKQKFKNCLFSKIENAIGEDGRTTSRYLSRSSSVERKASTHI
ncbi:chemokine-like receptor 1 [Megalops cyprinoides]|uniref:chemokine-like receptor 1 n=1 Tax=Megalops cyprinoides TaxID=118141 RepID=UPI0018652C19|nr:chemokine-like receptor 1 [Megalops cyprinoides]